MASLPWLILPTFNEAENLEGIVEAAGPALAAASPEGYRILVVDDSSPDGTGEIADRLAGELEEVEVLHRPVREGLGPAYIAGFEYALERDASCCLEMDCDFSHDPADLAPLLDEVLKGRADLALGSRYVEGGGIENWSPLRRLISRGSTPRACSPSRSRT
ncbi:MAG: glycosyltransferase [Solirubrobacterales bacterium]